MKWINPLSADAVNYAADHWRVQKSIARAQIDWAIKNEALSAYLPQDEFKEYVKLYVELDDSHPAKITRE